MKTKVEVEDHSYSRAITAQPAWPPCLCRKLRLLLGELLFVLEALGLGLFLGLALRVHRRLDRSALLLRRRESWDLSMACCA